MAIRVRTLANDERTEIERLAHSRTSPEIGQRLGLNPQTAWDWLKRFNEGSQ